MFSLRALASNQNTYSKAVQKLSSGLSVNTAGDGPAVLVTSEQLKVQTGGIEQAIKNSEIDVNVLQTADAALATVGEQLSFLKQIALHALNTSTVDPLSLETDITQAKEILDSVERFSRQTRFAEKNLLDGSAGATGFTVGKYLDLVGLDETTKSSPKEGYPVEIVQRATQSFALGGKTITQEMVDQGLSFKIFEGGRVVEYESSPGDTPDTVYSNLQKAINNLNVPLVVDKTPTDKMLIYHKNFGSKHSFQVTSNQDEVLSVLANRVETSVPGKDAVGSVNGVLLVGDGMVLRTPKNGGGNVGNVVLRYTYDTIDLDNAAPEEEAAGRLFVKQNSLYFQNSADANGGFYFSFLNISPQNLGRDSLNPAGIKNLAQIDLATEERARASIPVIEQSITEILQQRSKLGAAQKTLLEDNMNYLRIARENIIAAQSTIRDADVAEEISNVIKDQIQIKNSAWLLHSTIRLRTELQNLFQKSLEREP